jgi:chemotaxis protein histidine kinase CheA
MAVSKYDKEHLSTSQQNQIASLTQQAQSGQISWADAHSGAEAIRGQASGGGYSGSQYGNEYISSGSSGSSGNGIASSSGASTDGTNYHQDAINAAQAYAGGNGDWQAVLDALNARDQKTQQTGQNYGKTSLDILNELASTYKNPTDANNLKSQYQSIIDQLQQPVQSYGGNEYYELAQQITNMAAQKDYSDWTKSDQYQSLADRYGSQGKMTMQNVLGQISSRTGGLASSYATTAAQQQYNDYMAQLEAAAQNQYGEYRSDLLENANLAMTMGDKDYQQYLNEQSQQSSNNSAALDAIYNLLGIYQNDSNTAYNQQQAQDETVYNRGQTTKTDAQNRVYDYLVNQGGSVGDLDADLITASGYTTAELNAMEEKYKANATAAAAKSSGSSSSGSSVRSSSGTSSSKTSGKPTLTAAQTLAAINEGIVNDTTKAAYEYYYGQAYDDGSSDTNSNRTSFDYSEDEGIFTWNGRNYSRVNDLLSAMESANLTDAEKKTLTRKFNLFGFDISF